VLRIALIVAIVTCLAPPTFLAPPACLGPFAWLTPRAEARPGAVIYEIPIVPVEYLDPSIEGAGMGGASLAVFWQENPNDWINPALLGFHKGLRYGYGQTKLFPGLADDVDFTSHRILAGAWGVGVSMAGKPFDSVGRLRLSYGESMGTDEFGNVVGPFESHSDIHSLAVGVSLLDLASSVAVARGGEPIALSRRVSLAVGHTWKDVIVDLAPPNTAVGALSGEGSNRDYGAVVRVSLFDQIGDALDEPRDASRVLVEAGGAYSRLNYDEDGVVEYANDTFQPLPDLRQIGASARVTLALRNGGTGWFQDWSTPAIAFGMAWDQSDQYVYGANVGPSSTHVGGEASFFDVLYARLGHADEGSVNGTTFGLGLSLKYKGIAGLRTDWASYPGRLGGAVSSEPRQDRFGVTFFVDPYRWSRAR
jgi:hypothetical protein